MSHDLLIKNGLVVDGTGAPARRADIAVAAGRIADIGRIGESADPGVDVSDLVVSPGFIDPHTHYDAQTFWDPENLPSAGHRFTTAIIASCLFAIPPSR